MRIAVITRHAITNYGSLLQAFATQQVLENMGHTCEIIDYIREDEHYHNLEKTLVSQKDNWSNNPIKKIAYLAIRQPESLLSGRRFENEQRKWLHLTKRYTSIEQLTKDKPRADIYLTGSDQVWGPVANGTLDKSYFLAFTSEHDKRIAYAASFGRTDFSMENEKFYKETLKKYSHISVREDSALKIINSYGMDSVQVIDPTLLLDSKFWRKYTHAIKPSKYILLYQLHNDKRLGAYAKKVAAEMNLPLIRISPSLHQIIREGRLIWCPSIRTFLSYIMNATCMITDSFHGTAFAINFNIPFVEVLPNNGTTTRNISILKMTRLSEQILLNDNDIECAKRVIDFQNVNNILKHKRAESISILKRMIEE